MERPHDREHEADDVRAMDDALVAVCRNLLAAHRAWEFGDETLLARHGSVDGDRLRVGRAAYRVAILPEMLTIRRTTLDLLKAFAAVGGTVLAAGELPSRVDGVEDAAAAAELEALVLRVTNTPSALRDAVDDAAPPAVDVSGDPGGDVWLHEREVEQGRLVFVANTSEDRTVEAELRFRGAGRIKLWDLATGDTSDAAQQAADGAVTCRLMLAPLDGRLVVFNRQKPAETVPEVRFEPVETVELSERLDVVRHDPNALTLDACRLKRGNGPWSDLLPVIHHQVALEADEYAGPITLRFDFHVTQPPAKLHAVIEDAERFSVRVNDRPATYEGLPYYIDRSFHPVDITPLVVEGDNTLDLAIDFRPVAKSSFALASLFEVHEGTELEAVYLVGDFAVRTEIADRPAQRGCLRFAPRFSLDAESGTTEGDLTADGYPFYAGRAAVRGTVELPALADGQRAVVELATLDAALATVRVNGATAGAVLWPPCEVDVTDQVRQGANTVEIEFTSGLRNLLGPHHRSNGEPRDCWRTAFDYSRDQHAMQHPEEQGVTWTDDAFCVHFGTRGRIRVKIVEPT